MRANSSAAPAPVPVPVGHGACSMFERSSQCVRAKDFDFVSEAHEFSNAEFSGFER
jgi:hypothetical protein